MKFSRKWAMPNADTFTVPPIHDFVTKWLDGKESTVDPFARDSKLCKYTNDINPEASAEYCMDALDFLRWVADADIKADLVILDPPYSPRQVSECYKEIGLPVGISDTQNGALCRKMRDIASEIISPRGIVLSFGWNTVGMGKKRGYEIEEIMLVCHGGVHNDTICMAERSKPMLFT